MLLIDSKLAIYLEWNVESQQGIDVWMTSIKHEKPCKHPELSSSTYYFNWLIPERSVCCHWLFAMLLEDTFVLWWNTWLCAALSGVCRENGRRVPGSHSFPKTPSSDFLPTKWLHIPKTYSTKRCSTSLPDLDPHTPPATLTPTYPKESVM